MPGDPDAPSPETLALLAAQDWPRIRSGLVAYGIFRKCRPSDAEDFAHAAILRVRTGERAWDAADKPDLLVFLLTVVRSLIWNENQRKNRERPTKQSRVQQFPDTAVNPIEIFIERSDDGRGEEILAELLRHVEGDALAVKLVHLSQEGVDTVEEQSKLAGATKPQIRNTRERLRYHMNAIYEERGGRHGDGS